MTADDLARLRRMVDLMRQEHARHDLAHQAGAWPRACAACGLYRVAADTVARLGAGQ